MAILLYDDMDDNVVELVRKLMPRAKLVRINSIDDGPTPLLITEDGIFSGYEIYSYLNEKMMKPSEK